MKKIFNRLKDSMREIVQLLLICVAFMIPYLISDTNIVKSIIKVYNENIDSTLVDYFINKGRWTIGLFFAFICWVTIYSLNTKSSLNRGNRYHEHSYFWYLFCSKILGYKKCSLILVPVYMQFKLVIRGTFETYVYDNVDNNETMYTSNDNIAITTILNHPTKDNTIVNIMLSDTYYIDEKLLPDSKKELPTYLIKYKTDNSDSTRQFSEDFVSKVSDLVYELSDKENIDTINLFANTNPKHSYVIAERIFKSGNADRSDLKHLIIYQQNRKNGDWKFDEKEFKIY